MIRGATNLQVPYAKQISGLMMARTDFASLFRLIPEEEQNILKADKDLWVDLVVRTAAKHPSTKEVAKSHQLFKKGVGREGTPVNLTIEDWLKGILENKDLLSREFSTMGAMKDKVERIGPNAQEDAGIFEYRASQLAKLPLGSWTEFALQAHRYITRLHEIRAESSVTPPGIGAS